MVVIIMESFIKGKKWEMGFFVPKKEIFMRESGREGKEKVWESTYGKMEISLLVCLEKIRFSKENFPKPMEKTSKST